MLAGVKIGEDAMLGALALATKHVPQQTVSVGIPAKAKIQKQATQLSAHTLLRSKHLILKLECVER